MTDGVSGGVQQWIIGLASALSGLEDGSEEYLFLVKKGDEAWLTPYLAGRCRLFPDRVGVAPSPALRASAVSRTGGRRAHPLVRFARRLRRGLRARLTRTRVERPRSRLDMELIAARTAVMHFPRQSAFATSVPSIYQPWDLQHLHFPEFFSPESRAGREATYRSYCDQAALIIVATRVIKDDLCAQYGIAPDRVAVVNPPPVTVAYVEPPADEAAQVAARLALPDRYAFYPAQLWGHKNHERLFEALRLLRDRGVVVPLVCSGHLNERHQVLLEVLDRLGVRDQVRFLGYVSATEMKVLYRNAALLVFPSLYEGWGLPIVEAFAEGVPVACSNVTSLPDLVGDAALIFDPTETAQIASAIERLWVDEALRRGLVERGRIRLGLFDWHRTALLMRAHYRRVAGRKLTADETRLVSEQSAV
jgi:glycosyltransferase involved in cell wall biosynthesis